VKISRWRYAHSPHLRASFPSRVGPYWYEAKTVDGWTGIGPTPTAAILDARHETRMMRDSAEAGKCIQGRFHRD